MQLGLCIIVRRRAWIPWNGLELELELSLSSPESGAWFQPLGELEVTLGRVMPKRS